MMMKTNVQLLCEDLDQLLKDICQYLTTQAADENATENQRLFASKLIQRSKKQLQQISKVSMVLSTDVDDQSYVDMNKQSVPEVEEPSYEEGEDNEYTPIECPNMRSEQVMCPYEALPAFEIEKCEKFGHLDRKERFLFIGHQKKLYAGIKGNWLLLYCTRKDNKPFDNLNLSTFTAKPADSGKTKAFDVRCMKSQKAFQFIAQTPKDMMQWVACINKRAPLKEEVNNTSAADDDENEEENVYEQLKVNEDNVEILDTLKKKSKPLPPLPKLAENTYVLRRPKPETPVSDQESYDFVCAKDEYIHDDDDEDQIYDVIQEIKIEKSIKPKEIEKPNEVEKPNPINKVIQRPKLAESMRVDSTLTNSFTDDDEEAIYDVLEQPQPNKPLSATTTKQVDSEPEEEYCNLVQNPNAKSPVMQNFNDPDEEYSNLVSITNKAQIINTEKNSRTTIPTETALPQKMKKSDEECSKLKSNVKNTNKVLLPKPSTRPIVSNQPKLQDVTVNEEDVEEEYDFVVTPAKNSKSVVQDMIHEVNKHIKINQSKKEPPPLKPKPKPWRNK